MKIGVQFNIYLSQARAENYVNLAEELRIMKRATEQEVVQLQPYSQPLDLSKTTFIIL